MFSLLDFIPSWIYHLITSTGLLLILTYFILDFIPFINKYRLPVLIIGIVCTCVGLFFEGVVYSDLSWNAKVKEMEVKVAQAEAMSSQQNTKIVTKYITNTKAIKEKTDANLNLVEKYITKHDNNIMLPNSFIVLHNGSSQNEVSRSSGSDDDTPSDVKASTFLSTVTENYGTCYEMRELVLSWQEWYKEQRDIFNNAYNK